MSYIIGVSGPPGSGKTTLTDALSQSFDDMSVIYFDHYQSVVHKSAQEIVAWIDAGADYDTFKLPELVEDLALLKQGQSIINPINGNTIKATPIVFFETLFARAHHATGQYIDRLIWLDTPLDIALARTINASNALIQTNIAASQLTKRMTIDLQEHFRWQNNYIKSYLGFVSKTLHIQQQVKLSADLIIQGMDDAKVTQATAFRFIKDLNIKL